ncbi:class A beta-lactamase [Dyella mobilis]|uniref:Beta-lactamase n=1 Tax=Dyella mobilis TaxID=1849582 RepID=A0ABS2KEU5_9GAMM|nr:class A beta-lactamase [Dyella mobilis]MBM7129693.1 class A beta-lactamase [Dyella mobilis]GLQ98041.1 beta-lactamase [Dyella mobilis]
MDRRHLLKGALVGASAILLRPSALLAAQARDLSAALADVERRHGGRLGVAMLDTGNGQRQGYRADERFLMCSTFKMLLAAAVLARVDRGQEQLDRRLVFGKDVVLEYAPVTSQHIGSPGMSIAQLCQAAVAVSDNTAANVLLAHLGGPSIVTTFARQLGDTITRLDRIEPELNRPTADGLSDTTTPNAMLADLQKLTLGNVLSDASRRQLIEWLCETTTGKTLLRAGFPADWRVGEKTGSGMTQRNDVLIAWPPQRKPLLIAAYYANEKASDEQRAVVLAEVGRLIG